MVVINEEDYLAHYGILRKSGRYPWGSGKDVPTRNRQFLDYVAEHRRAGMTNKQIADGVGIKTTALADLHTIAKNRDKQAKIMQAERLHDKGYHNTKIAEIMGLPGESSVRALLAPGVKARAEILTSTADMLRQEVSEKKYVDVGTGVENHLKISKEKLRAAVAILKEEGYEVHPVKSPQLGTGFDTNQKVLSPPGTTRAEVYRNRDNIQQIKRVSPDGGAKWDGGIVYPYVSIHPDRVGVRYKEQGGDKLDGVIHVRPGVDDLSLGGKRYAQVRIKVGDDHYLKGMAMLKDDLPPGTDLLFHTNKSNTGNKLDAMKPLESDPSFPFKTVVRQIKQNEGSTDPKHPEKVTSAMNLVFEEGQWGTWSKSLSSQFLSKQDPSLARTQLGKTLDKHQKDLDEIMSLTNPAVKKKFLDSFSQSADSTAVHLDAAALHSRQAWHVILPVETMKETEVYAPNYDNGSRVVLIRHPHGGTFEIPELTVNNNHPEAKRLLGNAPDAIGIHHKVAERLSGADFDGDTVIVIPNNRGQVKTSAALQKLKGFDSKQYKLPDDSPIPRITPQRKQREMGMISNLITDMTLKGATHEELARAVKHSMVVIDSEKHGLDFQKSFADHGIRALKEEYQGGAKRGASTLISKAGSEIRLPDRKPRPVSEGGSIDPVSGKRMFVETGKTRPVRDKEGNLVRDSSGQVKTVPSTQKHKKLEIVDNAHDLSSGTRMEGIYAEHSNAMKDLANKARLASANTPPLKQNDSAKRVYSTQVESLNAKLHLAEMSAPLERQAQALARAAVKAKQDANPNLEGDTLKKVRFRELDIARIRTGAKKKQVVIEDKEWDAIQAGAISNSKLVKILANTDIEALRKRATPRTDTVMTQGKIDRAKALFATGATNAEVASQLGVSISTLNRSLQGGEQ